MNFAPANTLQVYLSAAPQTNQLNVVVNGRLDTSSRAGLSTMVEIPSPTTAVTAGTTPVTIFSVPADQFGFVESLFIKNTDTAPVTVNFQTTFSGTGVPFLPMTLQVGEVCCYERNTGWYAIRNTYPVGRLTTQNAAGTLFNTYTTAKSVINSSNVVSLGANFWTVGRTMEIEGVASLSSLVTTPGTFTMNVMMGAVIAFTSGAIQMTNNGNVLLPVWYKIWLTCMSVGSGTACKLMGQARFEALGIALAAGANSSTSMSVLLAPATTPALGTGFDSTVANTLDNFVGFSISNAANGWQSNEYMVNVY